MKPTDLLRASLEECEDTLMDDPSSRLATLNRSHVYERIYRPPREVSGGKQSIDMSRLLAKWCAEKEKFAYEKDYKGMSRQVLQIPLRSTHVFI